MHFVELDEQMNFYDYRKKIVGFPAYIGHAKAGEYVVGKWGRGCRSGEEIESG